jgi:hypothetical protein
LTLRVWEQAHANCSVPRTRLAFGVARLVGTVGMWLHDEQLSYMPERETRNRKPLERLTSFGATWELRFGANNRFRVFYEVNAAEQIVEILAIGVKEGNRLLVGGKEIQI